MKALNRLKLPSCAKWLKSSQRKALIIFGDVYWLPLQSGKQVAFQALMHSEEPFEPLPYSDSEQEEGK